MFNFMVTGDGGLTTAGYAIAIIAGIVLFLAAIYFAGKHSAKQKLTTRQLVFCAVAMALAFVTSYLKIFTLSHGLLKGYIAAVIARGAFHALGGYLYWMSYMPENFPKSLTAVYPIVYNYSYLVAEGVITVIVISIPAVAKALTRVKKAALGTSL